MNVREVNNIDIKLLLDLRNEPFVRQSAFNTKIIGIKTHRKWFKEKLSQKNSSVILIAENNGERIGQIRFDVDSKTNSVEIDIAIVSIHRGKRFGLKLLKVGCKYAFKKLHVSKIIAHIKAENIISFKTFLKAGFLSSGYINNYKSCNCIEMLLLDNNKLINSI